MTYYKDGPGAPCESHSSVTTKQAQKEIKEIRYYIPENIDHHFCLPIIIILLMFVYYLLFFVVLSETISTADAILTCGVPEAPVHGLVGRPTGNSEVGDMVDFQCLSGEKILTATCTLEGTWSPLLTCDQMTSADGASQCEYHGKVTSGGLAWSH